MKTLALLVGQLKAQVIINRRYWLNTTFQVLSLYVIFLVILLGYQNVSGRGAGLGVGVQGLVIAFVTFTFCSVALTSVTSAIIQDAQQGLLEQWAMSPLGLGRVQMCRVFSTTLVSLGVNGLLLLLAVVTTGSSLHFDVATIVPLILLVGLGAQGFGLILGGLALIHKRVQAAFSFANICMVALVTSNGEGSWLSVLPISLGAAFIRRASVHGATMSDIGLNGMLMLSANSVFWFLLGYLVFRRMELRARRDGLLAHY